MKKSQLSQDFESIEKINDEVEELKDEVAEKAKKSDLDSKADKSALEGKVGRPSFLVLFALACIALCLAVFALMNGGPAGPEGPRGPAGADGVDGAGFVGPAGPQGPAGKDADTTALNNQIAQLRKEMSDMVAKAKVTPPPAPAPAPTPTPEQASQPTYASFDLDWLADGQVLVLVRDEGGRKRGFGQTWAEPSSEVKKPKDWENSKWVRNSRGDWALRK